MKRRHRTAPGRRIAFVKAKNKTEAVAAMELMLRHLKTLPDNEETVIQSNYISKEGVLWFG